MPSFGLIFQINDTKIFITTDTQFTPQQLRDLYLEADIIFHDCETTEYASGVHANYQDLINLEPEIKSKMWLYHFNTIELPDAKKEGFCGFIKRGQTFEF